MSRSAALSSVEISPLVLANVLRARKVAKPGEPVLCTLLSQIGDDGCHIMKDCFETILTKKDDGSLSVNQSFYDVLINLFNRSGYRLSVFGFATTNMSEDQMRSILNWAISDPATSRFTSHVITVRPFALFVEPVSETQPLKVALKMLVSDGRFEDQRFRMQSVALPTKTQMPDTKSIIRNCCARIDKAVALLESADTPARVVDEVRRAISVPIAKDIDACVAAQTEEEHLYNYLIYIANIELSLASALANVKVD